jgi:membrane-bound lytic murein transglycosylase B
MKLPNWKGFIPAALLLLACQSTLAIDTERDDVKGFIDTMVEKHSYDREKLESVLAQAETKDSILEAIARPAERTLNWGEYRNIFMTKERIAAGTAFWQEHNAELQRISDETGVSIEILVGIIGVETYYGRITGSYRVLDALSTLAFDYPPRSKFFLSELEHFLLLVRSTLPTMANVTFGKTGATSSAVLPIISYVTAGAGKQRSSPARALVPSGAVKPRKTH